MLSPFLLGSALALSQGNPSRGPPPPPPVLFDHRDAFFLRAPSLTLTAEWLCPGSDRPSMARVAIRAYYDEQRRQDFRVSLEALHVNGAPVSRRVFESVASVVETLVNVGALQGTCRGREQRLLLHGFVRGGDPRTPSILRLNLTPNR